MEDEKMVVVREMSDEAEARIVLGFLRSRGIEAMISEDDAGDQIPAFELSSGVKIFVAAEAAARARQLLDERDAAPEDIDEEGLEDLDEEGEDDLSRDF
jgi:hypothetical protein